MRALTALGLAAFAACGGDRASPVRATVITYDGATGGYAFTAVTLNTLASLRHLRGTAGEVRAGGAVRVSPARLSDRGATVESLRRELVAVKPTEVDLAYAVIDGSVEAEDFESLQLLSAYASFEASDAALAAWGLPRPQARLVVAHAAIADEQGLSPLGPGELYFAPLGAFYLPPAQSVRVQQVPLAFNRGAVAHALVHEAVQFLWWGGAPVDAAEVLSGPDAVAARHLSRSIAEGLADFLSVAASNDPAWFAHSIAQAAGSRGLDRLPRCSTPDMQAALGVPDTQLPYDPYPLGTVLAGTLFEAALTAGTPVIAKGAFAAMSELGRRESLAQGLLTLPAALDAIVASAGAAARPELCGLVQNRFARLSLPPLPACAGVTPVSHPECQ